MLVLSIFEFTLYSRVGREPLNRTAESASTLALFEIIVGLFNMISLICGIILMINSGKYSVHNAAFGAAQSSAELSAEFHPMKIRNREDGANMPAYCGSGCS